MKTVHLRALSLFIALVLILGGLSGGITDTTAYAASTDINCTPTSLSFSAYQGYDLTDVPAQDITVSPTSGTVYDFQAAITESSLGSDFTITRSVSGDLTSQETITVQPKTGMTAGTHTAMLSLFGSDAVATSGTPVSLVSEDVSITFEVKGPPQAPTYFSATADYTKVHLGWISSVDATSYNIYQNGMQIRTGVTGIFCTIDGLTNGTSYSFTVRAVNPGGESADSNVATVIPSARAYSFDNDSYSFDNSSPSFGYQYKYRIPLARYNEIFSAAEAKYLYDGLGEWGGSCFGFSATSLMLFREQLLLSDYGNSDSINAIKAPKSSSAKLTQLFETYQLSQLLDDIYYSQVIGNRNKRADLVNAVKAFKEGTGSGVIVCVYGSAGGHAVVAYDITDKGNNNYELSIYDNNWPNDADRKMTINTSMGAWSYTLWQGLTFGSSYGGYFSFATSDRVYDAVQEALGQTGGSQMKITVPSDAQITNSAGTNVENIPDAFEIVPMGLMPGAAQPENSMFNVPDGSYNIQPGSSGRNAASLIDGGSVLNIQSSDPNASLAVAMGQNAFASINASGSSNFQIQQYTNNNDGNPLTFTGTIQGGVLDVTSSGDGCVMNSSVPVTVTVSNGTGSSSFVLVPGSSASITGSLQITGANLLGLGSTGGSDSDNSKNSGALTAQSGATTWLNADMAKSVLAAAKKNGQNYVATKSTGSYGIRKDALLTLGGYKYYHDTVENGNATTGSYVQLRMTIHNPGKATKDLLVSGYVNGDSVSKSKAFFEKRYKNKISVIHLEQQSAFGQPMGIAAKVNLTGFDTDNLCFYSYDKVTNKYTRIKQPEYRIDKNGYLHFTTELAGDIIISKGLLDRR